MCGRLVGTPVIKLGAMQKWSTCAGLDRSEVPVLSIADIMIKTELGPYLSTNMCVGN